MNRNEFDDLMQKFLEGRASLTEQQAVIEAMETDDTFFRRARAQVTLHAGLKALTDQKTAPFVNQLLEQISHQDGRRAFVDKVQTRIRSKRQRRRAPTSPTHESTQRQAPMQLTRAIIYSCAAAAALLLVTSLIALWQKPDPSSPLTEAEKRRHKVIVEQLRELNLERKAIETVKARRRPRPKPAAPAPDEATQLVAEQEAKEAEEAARFVDARRHFVMEQLRQFRGRGPVPDDLDVEAFDPHDPVPAPAPAIAEVGPVEVGRVLETESDLAGVLIRSAGAGSKRLQLKKDMALLRGDRIETARGGNASCTSVRLKGGTTIDIDRATSIEVLGRNTVRFHTGRIYAHIAVSYPDDAYPESEPPFSLQTDAGRFLTHDLQAELQVSSNGLSTKDLTARVDGGKVHLVNRKGYVMGRKGQELRVRSGGLPSRRDSFSKPIWRGRNRTNPELPIGKGNPVLLSHGSNMDGFNLEYALALAHTGEIDLRGIQIVYGGDASAAQWRKNAKEIARLRTTGLRFAPVPVMGASRRLRPPASGRYQDVTPEHSPAAKQLLSEARKVSPDRPLVVIASGSLTDLASAWLIDHDIAKRIVVVTDTKTEMRDHDPWAFRIVLEAFRCVSVHQDIPAHTFPTTGLQGTRWKAIVEGTRRVNRDFSRFACVTIAGFVQEVERARFINGPREDASRFRFQADPQGKTWLVKRTEPKRMVQEFRATFVTGPTAK